MAKCISPVDGSLVAERPFASDDEVVKAIDQAQTAQQSWRNESLSNRKAICQKAVDAMLAMRDEIAPELAWQMGRPVRYGSGELNGFQERASYMLDIADQALQPITPEPKTGFQRFIRREPLGIVFTIAPWNYPYLTAVNSVIPALVAGNAVLFKHAQQTLLVGERFQKAFDQAGIPTGLFQNMVLDHATTERIISERQVNHVCFTGSVDAGKRIEQAAAGTFTTLGLELGGKDPAYVRSDANLSHAVEDLVDGSFFNSGQSCCGIERIYVHAEVYDSFLESFVHLTRQYVLGNPLESETTLGPMASEPSAFFVRKHIHEAVEQGAIAHINPLDFPADRPGSAYLAPQVLSNVNHSMAVMKDETFGPVVGIMKVTSDDQAVSLMNDSPFGLTASIWTTSLEDASRLGEQIQTGTVFMNRADYLDPALAWTGVKDTGHGCTLSRIGYEMLTRPKSFHLRLPV